jgi:Protein of unknown function (DUF1778)
VDLRTSAEERELIDRAARASGTDLTDFVITHASEAARRMLADHHDLTEFRCRSTEQTEWRRRHAGQSAGVGTTRVCVVTEHHSHRVVAYYA